ncbi:unnamed protein product [Darwinula stevensoni]|uniref:Uncharacterized protein n=1 Tax=Darwinula stevensoni TaxID=69355 RepID=A0A7R8WZ99_9CRUS|nr:unnamed protein product [Darwinula stevensoni]CAG0879818.1 unnamed protein product [Darwinula stevensoni]
MVLNLYDIQSPIQFRLNYTLIQEDPKPVYEGQPLPDISHYPILNQTQAIKDFEATFLKDCGEDKECQSDLNIQASLLNLPKDSGGYYLLHMGEKDRIQLHIAAENTQEPAYMASLYVRHSDAITFIKAEAMNVHPCFPYNVSLVECSLGNPFKKGSKNLTIYFNHRGDNEHQKLVEMEVFANTTSQEPHPKPVLEFKIRVVKKAELVIRGVGVPEQTLYGWKPIKESDLQYLDEIGPRVDHVYEVINNGPLGADRVTVHIDWPYQVNTIGPKRKWLLYIITDPIVEGDGECVMPAGRVNYLGLDKRFEADLQPLSSGYTVTESKGLISSYNTVEYIPVEPSSTPSFPMEVEFDKDQEEKIQKRKKYEETKIKITKEQWEVKKQHVKTSSTSSKTFASGRDVYNVTRAQRVRRAPADVVQAEAVLDKATGKKRQVVTMDCDRETAECFRFTCNIRNLLRGQTATIRVLARLFNETLIADYPSVDQVIINSKASLEIDPGLDIDQDTTNDVVYVSTNAQPDLDLLAISQGVPWWVILVSVLGGLLLLALIIWGCYKCGFFKRKRPDPTLSGNLEERQKLNAHGS